MARVICPSATQHTLAPTMLLLGVPDIPGGSFWGYPTLLPICLQGPWQQSSWKRNGAINKVRPLILKT